MLSLTPKAVEKFRGFIATDAGVKGKSLRVKLVPAGCAGFKYDLTFDVKQAEDTVIPQQGFDVVVDKNSLSYLESVTIDYNEDALGSGFKITNPKEKGSCGCGESKQF